MTYLATFFRQLSIVLALVLLSTFAAAREHKTYAVHFRSAANNMILLDGTVNGKPVTFLLDTGAPRTTVSFNLANVPLASVRDAEGRGKRLTTGADISALGGQWVNLQVGATDVRKLTNMDVDGLLGQDVLRGFRSVRIDYEHATLELEN